MFTASSLFPALTGAQSIADSEQEERLRDTRRRAVAARETEGEERQCKQQQIQTVTHDTQQINSAVTVFAIIIQTKINKNDSPAQRKGG